MILCFVAGPLRAPSEFEVALNIKRASARASELWERLGPEVYPMVPHQVSAWDPARLTPDRDARHREGVRALLARCDAALFPTLRAADLTEGQRDELREAISLGVFCCASIEQLEAALPELRVKRNLRRLTLRGPRPMSPRRPRFQPGELAALLGPLKAADA